MISFVEIKQNSTICSEHELCFTFEISRKSLKPKTVKLATFVLHTFSKSLIHSRIRVRITFIPLSSSKTAAENLQTETTIDFVKSEQVSIDVTNLLQSPLRAGVSKCFLKLSLYTSRQGQPENQTIESPSNLRLSPLLAVTIQETIPVRGKRSLDCGEYRRHCCRQRLYVTFKELGWDDWIIMPRGFYTNYCRGICMLPSMIRINRSPTTYFMASRITNIGNKSKPKYELCCTPVKFSGLRILYYDADGIIWKRIIPDVIIEECACRSRSTIGMCSHCNG